MHNGIGRKGSHWRGLTDVDAQAELLAEVKQISLGNTVAFIAIREADTIAAKAMIPVRTGNPETMIKHAKRDTRYSNWLLTILFSFSANSRSKNESFSNITFRVLFSGQKLSVLIFGKISLKSQVLKILVVTIWF